MAAGLAALLDDIAALARVAAASVDDIAAAAGRASMKAAGVVVDDAAVTPRYVTGLHPSRELPIIRRIAVGSLRNKLLFILPAALLLSQFLPWLLTPILMLGGLYLCFEGAEKLWEMASGQQKEKTSTPVVEQGSDAEKTMVRGAIRTDFILSAEIMVIALNEVAAEAFWSRALILIVVAVLITAVVYGAVAIIVKMDDVGLHLATTREGGIARFGERLVKAMPTVLSGLSIIGMVAMLWVGGHILLVGIDDLGWPVIYDAVGSVEDVVAGWVPAIGGFLAWLVNTFFSAILGIVAGGIIVVVVHQIKHRKGGGEASTTAATRPEDTTDAPDRPV